MNITWKLIVLVLSLFVGLVFLVYEGKVDSQVLETLVSALTGAIVGGGAVHIGSRGGGD
jgi:hypothetical protein